MRPKNSLITFLVYEFTADGFVYNALAGAIPTEIGQLTQLVGLSLRNNQLTGASETHLIAILVYKSTADSFVPENALAGAIPTDIGQLTRLMRLELRYNQLTGASKTYLIASLVYE